MTAHYIVLEWPQPGSSSPDVADTSVFTSLYDVDDSARSLTATAKEDGRPATYTIHKVDMDVVTL